MSYMSYISYISHISYISYISYISCVSATRSAHAQARWRTSNAHCAVSAQTLCYSALCPSSCTFVPSLLFVSRWRSTSHSRVPFFLSVYCTSWSFLFVVCSSFRDGLSCVSAYRDGGLWRRSWRLGRTWLRLAWGCVGVGARLCSAHARGLLHRTPGTSEAALLSRAGGDWVPTYRPLHDAAVQVSLPVVGNMAGDGVLLGGARQWRHITPDNTCSILVISRESTLHRLEVCLDIHHDDQKSCTSGLKGSLYNTAHEAASSCCDESPVRHLVSEMKRLSTMTAGTKRRQLAEMLGQDAVATCFLLVFRCFSKCFVAGVKVCEVAWAQPHQCRRQVERYRNSLVMLPSMPDESVGSCWSARDGILELEVPGCGRGVYADTSQWVQLGRYSCR